MGYRKGHYKKDGTYVKGHYVKKRDGKQDQKSLLESLVSTIKKAFKPN